MPLPSLSQSIRPISRQRGIVNGFRSPPSARRMNNPTAVGLPCGLAPTAIAEPSGDHEIQYGVRLRLNGTVSRDRSFDPSRFDVSTLLVLLLSSLRKNATRLLSGAIVK